MVPQAGVEPAREYPAEFKFGCGPSTGAVRVACGQVWQGILVHDERDAFRQVCKSIRACHSPGLSVEMSNYRIALNSSRSGVGAHRITGASNSALK